jgi:tetratricopeptide (TPR) repeat protein
VSSDRVGVGDIPREPPAFLPRDGLLAGLDRPGDASPAIYVLAGPPGSGKTQLAAAYARAKLAAGWRLVAWVNAGTSGTLLAGLAAVADALGLPADRRERDTPDVGEDVRCWLEADGDRCLLVFDGAEDLAALKPFVPARGAARVLITATRPTEVSTGTGVPVDVATPAEAAAFLASRTGLTDGAGAAAVAAELGCLPLALAQAAAVIAAQHLEYPAYLERLRTASAEEPAQAGEPPHQAAAAQAASLALNAAWTADETGMSIRVMAIMAVLSASGVRRELLQAAGQAGMLASGGQRVMVADVDGLLADLAERSLLTPTLDGRAIVMHRLVAEATRSWLTGRKQLMAACRAAAAALEAWTRTLDAARDRPAARDLPEQVTVLLRHASGPDGRPNEGLARALLLPRFLALYYLIELGDSAPQAVAVGEPLTADLERWLGPYHSDTLNARNSLAAAYLAAGRPAEAIPLFERTLVGRERTLGPDHPDTLNSQNNLAVAYQDAGRFAESILLFRLTLAARGRRLGTDHPDTLNSRGNLAAAYRAADRAAEAIPLLEQTLAGREQNLGPGHPDTQAARNNLDQVHREASRPPEELPPPSQLHATQPAVEQPPAEMPLAVVPTLPADPEPAPLAIEPVTEEPVPEEPAAEELVAEEPVAEEPTAEEPTAEEPGEDAAGKPELAGDPEPVAPPAGADRPAVGRSSRRPAPVLRVAAAILILLVVGAAAFTVSRLHAGRQAPAHHGARRAPPATAAQMAADWVSQQVSHSVTVACDPLMCAALEARGVPTTRLMVLRTGTASPRGAGVVVATPAVRSQFGSRLDSEYAPSVIAGFGSGAGLVEVEVVAPDGAAAYRVALRQDQAARKAAGTELLVNKQIAVAAPARTQLAAGLVDSRLLILLPALVATHPVQILAFGGSGPGAGPDSPLCRADLSGSGRAAGMTDASYQQWLISFVKTQLAHFTGTVAVVRQGGQAVVRIQFSWPSPLGLLSAT